MKIEGRRALRGTPVYLETLESLIVESAEAARPAERLTVSEAAEKYRRLNNPGAYVGPWLNDTTAYLVEPMNTLQSMSFEGMIFAGPAQSGKSLCVETPIATTQGWKAMGEIRVGDCVFGSDGKPTKVVIANPVQHGRPCFKVTFDEGTEIVADGDHRWLVEDCNREGSRVLTTAEMLENGVQAGKRARYRIVNAPAIEGSEEPLFLDNNRFQCLALHIEIRSIEPVQSVPVRCIGVDAEDHLFLAGFGLVPTHNTDMALNWISFSAKCDPADMMIVQTSQTTSRDFSMRRIDRLHRHSPEIGALLSPGKQADNTFDKHYRNGMLLTLSWPTINELSGKPIPRLWLTDYDRMDEDIDGEGSAFDLAKKRATTFRSHGMCAAESSPGYVIENPKWVRKTKHEAPPTKGILSLYNRGDRRRWLWCCPTCQTKFEPDFDLLVWDDLPDIMEASESVRLPCPGGCGTEFRHDPVGDTPGKHGLNKHGRWVQDGMTWTKEGLMTGTPMRSTIASFWLKGVAAAFSTWKGLVFNYLMAEREYEASGSEDSLKTTINTDQGLPYLPKMLANDRVPEEIKARSREIGQKVVPPAARFLIGTVDVQKNRFVVQIHGIALNGDIYVVDRYDIRKSKRPNAEVGGFNFVSPFVYAEDWKLLSEDVLAKTYPLGDGSGRHMAIRYTLCDSGGAGRGTANAYNFFRWLRTGDSPEGEESVATNEEGTYGWDSNMAGRFMLLKGATSKTAPRVHISYPDSQRKDRHAGSRGEIPVAMLNANSIKDMVDNRLDRVEPGGRFVFPKWLDENFYIELTVEVKDAVKGWINPRNYRNESWDLLYYCIAATLHPAIMLERMDHDDLPGWAEEWDNNDLVFDPQLAEKPFDAASTPRHSLASLASTLA